MNKFTKKIKIFSYCLIAFAMMFLLGFYINDFIPIGFAKKDDDDCKDCKVCSWNVCSSGTCAQQNQGGFAKDQDCPTDECSSNKDCSSSTTTKPSTDTKRCCAYSCMRDGTCAQRCADIPVSQTCPRDSCSSNRDCSSSNTKRCCAYSCMRLDGDCAQRCADIPVSQTCPRDECSSNRDCSSSNTKRCCAYSCMRDGTCAQRCADIPVSQTCPRDSCKSNNDCSRPTYTCMYCCSYSKSCEPYTSERRCAEEWECTNDWACQAASGQYTYMKCSGNKCVESKTNYDVPDECEADRECGRDDYHKECVATPYSYITYDADGNRIRKTGITYNCTQVYYSGSNECSTDASCCPGGNCGGDPITTYYCNKCSNGSCVTKSYSSRCSDSCQNDSECSDTGTFDFSLNNPNNITVIKPSSGEITGSNVIKASLDNGASKTVSFSQDGLPSGVNADSISSCSPTCSKTNILTINSSASAGVYPITVTATGGGITRKASYFLIIKKEGSEPIRGCTDSTALNYNPEATIDDGSCEYEYEPPEEPEECKISNFDVPDMMWVGYPRTAEWSTNEVCETGKITCKLKDGTDCGDREDLSSDNIRLEDRAKPFTIYQPGYYQYEFEACGPNNCDTWGDGSGAGEPQELPIIRAINLPIWQEINPVLPKKDAE